MKIVYFLKMVLVALLIVSQVEMPVLAYNNGPQKVIGGDSVRQDLGVSAMGLDGLPSFERANRLQVVGITNDSVIEFASGLEQCGFLTTEEFFTCEDYEEGAEIEGKSFIDLEHKRFSADVKEIPFNKILIEIVLKVTESVQEEEIDEESFRSLGEKIVGEIKNVLSETYGEEVPLTLALQLENLEMYLEYAKKDLEINWTIFFACTVVVLLLTIGCIILFGKDDYIAECVEILLWIFYLPLPPFGWCWMCAGSYGCPS